jgi:hypothetical protein
MGNVEVKYNIMRVKRGAELDYIATNLLDGKLKDVSGGPFCSLESLAERLANQFVIDAKGYDRGVNAGDMILTLVSGNLRSQHNEATISIGLSCLSLCLENRPTQAKLKVKGYKALDASELEGLGSKVKTYLEEILVQKKEVKVCL